MTILRVSILVFLWFKSQASAELVQGECSIGKIDLAADYAINVTLDEIEEDTFISEASYSAPAPKTNTGLLGADLGEPQHLDEKNAEEIKERIAAAREYLQNEVMVNGTYEKVRPMCKNRHQSCAFWSVLGECENNPGYMLVNCAPVCSSCEMLHVETRCPMDPDAVDALYPGDVNKMFEKIAFSPEYQQYEPVVVSRPPEGPWMIVFENIISDEEAKRLIELGGLQGYERSADVGAEKPDGTFEQNVNSGRTSTNAWCLGECNEDPVAQRVIKRIENITGIPEVNSENLQLLRYENNQFYQTHSDYIPYQVDRPMGARILTFYMYLSDVEEGGGTNFPYVNKTVTPKRGRAALWPSVLNEDPNSKDSRTNHQALPVIKGVKYGANAWIHQRDYKEASKKGC